MATTYCHPIHHQGALDNLHPSALLVLRNRGTQLVTADGATVRSFELSEQAGQVHADQQWHAELPAGATHLADVTGAVLATWDTGGQTGMGLVADGIVRKIATLNGKVTAMTAAFSTAILALEFADTGTARLVRLDVGSGAILVNAPLSHGDVDLQLDPSARWLTVTDRVADTVCTTPATLATWQPLAAAIRQQTTIPPAAVVAQPAGPKPSGHGNWCCCACCCGKCGHVECPPPTGPGGGTGGGQGGGQGGGTGCQPGGAGAPTGGGGTVVGNGGHVSTGNGDGGDCQQDLLWPIYRILATTEFAVAVDQGGRNLAVLSLSPFAIVLERQFGRGGSRIALDRQGQTMLIRRLANPARADFELLHLDVTAAVLTTAIRKLPVPIVFDTATFYGGLQIESLMTGRVSPTGPIRVLILPVIEGAQTFSDSDVSHFAAYINRVAAPKVVDFYTENSFGALHDISFHVFGGDVGPPGKPIQLRTHVADYFYPSYQAAALLLIESAIPAGTKINFDGRESAQISVQPDGGQPSKNFDVKFFALAFRLDQTDFPVSVQFNAGDKLILDITAPVGGPATLTITITAQTAQSFTITSDPQQQQTIFGQLADYLDNAIQAAEQAAGFANRIFARPTVQLIPTPGSNFGSLITTLTNAAATPTQLAVKSTSQWVGNTGQPNPLGTMHVGNQSPDELAELGNYLEVCVRIAEEAVHPGDPTRWIHPVNAPTLDATRTLTTTLTVGDDIGGPAASITLANSAHLDQLFTTSSTTPNSQSTVNNSEALRDDIFTPAWSGAVAQLQNANVDPKSVLLPSDPFHVVIVLPVEPAVAHAGDPDSVQPSEMWNVTPLYRPFFFRGLDTFTTVAATQDNTIQLQAVWNLDFFIAGDSSTDPNVGKPDVGVMCHELGHGLGFRDLYWATGYRSDLHYLGSWAIMGDSGVTSHHCGYHKLEVGWITDDRISTVAPTDPNQQTEQEFLLVPIELWDNNYPADARAAFGAPTSMPVVQLIKLDLGGDEAEFGLIEARQAGAHFSQNLPANPAIIVTNALDKWDDDRWSFNNAYRREVQLLNPYAPDSPSFPLAAPGDSLDLAKAPGLPAAGITVTVLDVKTVRAASVFHVKVDRKNTAFVDLYFSNADPYYKNPDLYVDWPGDNPSKADPSKDFDQYPIGSPTNQGEAIRVPPQGSEPHWVVARVRNRGGVAVDDVKLEYLVFTPPGGGDSSGRTDSIGTTTIPAVPAADPNGDGLAYGVLVWNVDKNYGHVCLKVQIADYKIPTGPDGAALASDDVWLANNHAQKNVDQYIPLSGSPYDPIEFDYSVHNDAIRTEYAYLEPDNLPAGMKLTVTPRRQPVPPKSTVIFHCRLELDETVIDAGCRSDRQFRIVTWRQDPESSVRWGGVHYKVMPRKRCAASLAGWWDYSNTIHLNGSIAPNPNGGTLRLWLAFAGTNPSWTTTPLAPDGTFNWQGPAPADTNRLNAVAVFDGNLIYGPAESPPLPLSAPPPIH